MSEKKTEEAVTDLKDLDKAVAAKPKAETESTTTTEAVSAETETETVKKEPVRDAQGRSYGTGRRKNAIARVWVKPGKGKVTVNGKEQENYFGRKTHLLVINQPFLVTGRMGEFDVICTVKGGGLSGQAGAVRHGISRALENFEPDLRPTLKAAGMLTRDPRAVERKKVGKHKARRTKQWAKR